MKKSHADVLDQVRALRQADDADWATSPAGLRTMSRALDLAARGETDLSPRRRRTLVVAAVTLATLSAGAAATAMVAGMPDDPDQAFCHHSFSEVADSTESRYPVTAELGPTEACRATWAELAEHPDSTQADLYRELAETRLVSCVNKYGFRVVFPVPAGVALDAACARLDGAPEDMQWRPDAS